MKPTKKSKGKGKPLPKFGKPAAPIAMPEKPAPIKAARKTMKDVT